MADTMTKAEITAVAVAVAVVGFLIWKASGAVKKVATDVGTGVGDAALGVLDWAIPPSFWAPEVVQPTNTVGVDALYAAYGITTLNGHFNDGSPFARDYARAQQLYGSTPTYSQILAVKNGA